jgi:ribonuclease P protein subunit POP4
MSLTPATLPRHELVGLPVRVADASDSGKIGIAGRVVAETTSTLSIRGYHEGAAGGEPRVRQVPKRGTTFEFVLTDETADGESPPTGGARKGSGTAFELAADSAAAGESVAHVTVDGARLHARPAERTETRSDFTWR